MSRYKLIVEKHQVTLVDTETGRQESYAEDTRCTAAHLWARKLCREAGINIETEDRR